MSIVEQNFREERCRYEDGIYLADDTFILLQDNLPALPIRDVAELVLEEPGGWTDLTQTGQSATGTGFLLSWGETSWEGSGYLALLNERDGSLRWLLHSSVSEPFVRAMLVENAIHASSAEYPTSWDWIIPIKEPWLLSAQRRDTL